MKDVSSGTQKVRLCLPIVIGACIKRSLGLPELPWDFQKSMPGSLGLPPYKDIYNKNIEWIYVLFSLRMVVLVHKWEFKNIEAEFLKVSEKIWSPGLPDIGATCRKSRDFLILTVSANTE